MDHANQIQAYRESREYKALRRVLLQSLESRGLKNKAYTDKAEEYLSLWCLFRSAVDDVDRRGLFLVDDRGRSTKNDSANLAAQTSRQMLAIFTALGFQAGDGEDDDEL